VANPDPRVRSSEKVQNAALYGSMRHYTVPLYLTLGSGFATEIQCFPILYSLQANSGAYIAHCQFTVSLDFSDQDVQLTTYLYLMSSIGMNTSNPPYVFKRG